MTTSLFGTETIRDRFRGCLVLGAAGDALGYPVEFLSENSIRFEYGEHGIQTLQQAGNPAHFSDDTQMTLYTACGQLYGMANNGEATASDVWLAYREWLHTQGDDSRLEPDGAFRMWITGEKRLNALRAPGNTCLSAIRHSDLGGTTTDPINNSKGCGGVMRVAPCGLALERGARPSLDRAVRMGADCAALTHSHPLGWLPAAALAGIVRELVYREDTATDDTATTVVEAIDRACVAVADCYGNNHATQGFVDYVKYAVSLALAPPAKDIDAIHELGEGWVGDEALGIAVYAAIRYADNPAQALRLAVNHRGDADSTGAVCGNILGALYGYNALAKDDQLDLEYLELRELIVEMSDDLWRATLNQNVAGTCWLDRYRDSSADVSPLKHDTQATSS